MTSFQPTNVSKGGSFWRQLWSTMKLLVLQRIRAPISSIVELLIPILFIAGTIILSILMKDKDGKGGDYSSYINTTIVTAGRTHLFSSLCYNETRNGGPIDGLIPCSQVVNATTFNCYGVQEGLPLDGICLSFDEEGINPAMLLFALIEGYQTNMVPVPSFDDMVKFQWIAKCLTSVSQRGFSTSIAYSGLLYAVPENSFTSSLVSYLNTTTSLFKYVFGGYFNSTKYADDFMFDNENDLGHWGIIDVEEVSMDAAAPHLKVAIRLNSSAIPRTTSSLDQFYPGGTSGYGAEYLFSGFLTLQDIVYQHYMSNVLRITQFPKLPYIVPMPTVDYVEHTFLTTAGQIVPLMVVLGFLYPVSLSTKRIVLDKELRLKEALLIMGLRQSVQYISWFIVAFIQSAVISIIIAILLKVTYVKQSNFGIIFFLFFLFVISSVAISGLIAAFFSKARLSSMLAPLVYFILSTPLFAVQSAGPGVIMGLCVLSPTAFAQGLALIFNYETATGMQTKDLASSRDAPKFIFILFMLAIDTILYIILMLYFDAVMPNDWGTPRNPFFCILDPIMWCCQRKKHWESDEDGRNPKGVFEPLTDDELRRSTVTIDGLTKKFRRGKETFLAVNHLHWALVEGEISVLLGHNGAGKSTAMNMMTGMLQPDGGDCHIYGHSIRKELSDARQEIGFCPQHNILWPDLSCYEHLVYFSSIKGLSGTLQKETIDMILAGVDLEEKRTYCSSALSGGQKRKLSVAIAFVGGSRLVFLDEPTAGMDVGARRHTWEVLRKMATGRTILLSTHFMDEADILGDRIAIMSKGRLQCAGSSIFLKSNLGIGYNITMSTSANSDRRAIETLIRTHVPPADVLSSGAGEVSFRLPMSFVRVFSSMLADIESLSNVYGIQGYTLSATTLEEIFLRIAHEEEEMIIPAPVEEEKERKKTEKEAPLFGLRSTMEDKHEANRDDNGDIEEIVIANPMTMSTPTRSNTPPDGAALRSVWDASLIVKESTLINYQLRASLLKRCLNALRDRRTQCIQIVFPVIMIVFAMILNMINFSPRPSLDLSSNMYESKVRIDGGNCANAFNTSIPFSSESTFYDHPSTTEVPLLSQFLLSNYHKHDEERFGSLSCNDATLDNSALFYNYSAPHAVAVGMVGYYGAMVQHALSQSFDYLEDIFTTSNYPMPRTRREAAFRDMMKALLVAMLIMIPFSFVPSTFVGWVVKERECKARHLQNVSGLRFSIYWLSNYIFDLCSYIVTMILVIIVLLIFQREEYVSSTTIGATIILLFTYGASCIFMSYAVSFLFREHSTAQNVVMLVNFITGFLLVLLVTVLNMLPSTEKVADGLRWAFRIVPSYCIGEGIINLASLDGRKALGLTTSSPWGMDVIGWPVVYMAIEVPVFALITLFIDHPTRRMRTQMLLHSAEGEPESISNEDEDVLAERERVAEQRQSGINKDDSDLVQVFNLRKVYDNGKVAVRNITFGVKPGEVFGFLGTNGAGKTTTISILCQEMVQSSGYASICGKDIIKDSRDALRFIGYCPQFDALLDLLTVEEHLQLYAGVRGVVPEQRADVVRDLMKLCELTEYKKTRAEALSGGNKRKLSVALALIGGPRVVFLDEPSAGMDPVARRGLWTAIQTISGNCSVVLTTHHLEEVEALAHRVAIMVDGTLRCIGNKTHLKQKYGSGFEMTLRAAENVPREQIQGFVQQAFPDAKLNEVRGQRYTYALPLSTSLSTAFGQLEENKEMVGIVDYSVSQTSIEQVFLRISEAAEAEAEGYVSSDINADESVRRLDLL